MTEKEVTALGKPFREGIIRYVFIENVEPREFNNSEFVDFAFEVLKSRILEDIPEGEEGSFENLADYQLDTDTYRLSVRWTSRSSQDLHGL